MVDGIAAVSTSFIASSRNTGLGQWWTNNMPGDGIEYSEAELRWVEDRELEEVRGSRSAGPHVDAEMIRTPHQRSTGGRRG